ncbi:hypothetical protein N9M39_00070 [Halieaceae bacterium]|nr:hypothetical protein [Halieaceae bacterium]
MLLCALVAYALTSAVVPAGYMAASLGAGTPVHLCPGDSRSALLIKVLAAPGMDHHHHHHGHGDSSTGGSDKGSAEPGCSLGGFGPATLAGLAGFPDDADTHGIAPPLAVSRAFAGAHWLRPPVRSPPA